MDALERDYVPLLLAVREPPCVSLYQPTHRHHPDNLQDPIRFRNLVRSIRSSLRDKYPRCETRSILEQLEALAGDELFWNRTLDGLAVIASADMFKVYRLLRPVPERVVVADSFHTKPLMRILQSADRYNVLGLSLHRAWLFEGNRDEMGEVDPAPGMPRTIDEVVEPPSGEPERRNRVYGAAGGTTRHGTDLRDDKQAIESERFFRAVDRAVLERHSRPTGMPLLLAALPEHHRLFRTVSRNPLLLAEAIDTAPDALSLEELRARAWQIMLPHYLERLAGLSDRFAEARAKSTGTDDLAEVAAAATAGRVETVLIDADRHVPGIFDATTGRIEHEGVDPLAVDDLLDDIGEGVLRTGGEVIVVPSERMPTATGVAAIYRY